ncbi:MAG: hypothetical protein Q6K08_07795, partial [Thermostichales cyanobacterium GMQP_bins_62]
SLWRTVKTPKAGKAKVVRKQVEQPIRRFVDGQYYVGTVNSIGTDGLTLVASRTVAEILEVLRLHYVPLIGLEMATPTMTHRLIGKVEEIGLAGDQATIEVGFPAQLEKQQANKIAAAFTDVSTERPAAALSERS